MNTTATARAARLECERAAEALDEAHAAALGEVFDATDRKLDFRYERELRKGAVARAGVAWSWANIAGTAIQLFLVMAACMPPNRGESAVAYGDRLDAWIKRKWREETQ